MTKQELARKRNFFKYNLLGVHIGNTDQSILNETERIRVNHITSLIQSMIISFDDNSRELGLKVPEYKCWCGKEGKYSAPSRVMELGYIKVCKKHIIDE